MAEISTIARPYAEALFRVARQEDLQAWAALAGELSAVAAHPEMRTLVAHPKLTDQQLYELFTAAVKTPLSASAQNFIKTLIENGRLSVLPVVVEQFLALKNAHEGTAEAEIVSAFPLSEGQLSELVSGLERKFKIKLKPVVRVDQNLIGGVRVSVGDQVLDTSVKAQLNAMRTALAA